MLRSMLAESIHICAAWTGQAASGVGVDDTAWAEACQLTVPRQSLTATPGRYRPPLPRTRTSTDPAPGPDGLQASRVSAQVRASRPVGGAAAKPVVAWRNGRWTQGAQFQQILS